MKRSGIRASATFVRSVSHVALAAGATIGAFGPAFAQPNETAAPTTDASPSTQAAPAASPGVGDLTGDIIVTARKRAEDVQDVPLAITAFGERQLQALNFRDIGSLGKTMPNVAFDENGTFKGQANFSIRGLGTASSIPSIDPTVGLFVDGVYQGIGVGQVVDQFDLEAVEVLRGPQGVLFGRNVTGGAVLIRTKKPSDTFAVNARVAVETGLRVVTDATVTGPLAEGLTAKLAGYYSHDAGFFRNRFTGKQQGQDEQYIIRPSVRYQPTDNLELLLRVEHGKQTGDGPANRNLALAPRNSFRIAINEPGYILNRWTSATSETNIGTAFGDGTITNIFGWRKLRSDSLGDIDGTTDTVFHIIYLTDQEQFSDELRYAGTFGPVEVTTGLYAFTQKLHYVENRFLTTPQRTGGGEGRFDTLGAFAAADWHLADQFTLNAGVRYSYEKKKASIGTVRVGGGDLATRSFIPNFDDSKSYSDVSPRIGIQFEPSSNFQAFASYAKGFRSGGYNFRITVPGVSPGPTDPESLDAYEVGFKYNLPDRRGNVNVSVFHNTIKDIQRDIFTAVPGIGSSQQVANAGTFQIKGFEAEANIRPFANLVIGAQVGYLDGQYKDLIFDLSGDGQIDDIDFALKLPRLSPWTYGGSINLDIPFDLVTWSTRVSFNHRDQAFGTDNNLGILRSLNILDFNSSFRIGDHWSFAFYGTNLLNIAYSGNGSVQTDTPAFGGDGPTGPRPRPTFSPLARGRVLGIEARYRL